jgi:uncharacterized protein (DUF362 family)
MVLFYYRKKFYVLNNNEEQMPINRRDFLKTTAAGTTLIVGGAGVLTKSVFAMNPSKFQEKSDISFVGSSSDGTRRKMIADVLEPWRENVTAGIENKTILIKVNMVYWNSWIEDPTLSLTHVDAVRGLLDFLRSLSTSTPIIIGDCTCTAGPAGDVVTMFTNAGYDELKNEYTDITLADLNTMPNTVDNFWTPEFASSGPVSIPIVKAFTDPKCYVISICRPKTHNCAVMTGVNKNILMGAPLNSGGGTESGVVPKQFMHGMNGWYSGTQPDENKCLAYNMYQMANVIYSTGSPALCVLDAWEGMEGDGPASGTGVMQYCAVAGIDPLAVDRIAAKLMGFSDTATEPMNNATPSYTDMRALVWISNAGFGNYDLSKINFIKGSIADVENYVKSYTMSPNYTGDPSYETTWAGGPPPIVLDKAGTKDSHFLDPKPYMKPQLHKTFTGGEVRIEFSLPASFHIHLGIFSLQGAEIRLIDSRFLTSGKYAAVWDCRDDTGAKVASGNYCIRLSFGQRSLSDKITIVR